MPSKTITLSDGSVWEYRDDLLSAPGCDAPYPWRERIAGYVADLPFPTEQTGKRPRLTANDLRLIADVLAPAVREALDVPLRVKLTENESNAAHAMFRQMDLANDPYALDRTIEFFRRESVRVGVIDKDDLAYLTANAAAPPERGAVREALSSAVEFLASKTMNNAARELVHWRDSEYPVGAAERGGDSDRFRPAEVFHPSEYIAEEAIARGWDLWELVRQSGVPEQEWPVTVLSWKLYAAVSDNASESSGCYMGADGAAQLQRAFGVAADFWLALESYWRTNIDRHTPMTDQAYRDWYWPEDAADHARQEETK